MTCIEGAQSGRVLFTGGGDGLVLAHDLRMREPTMVLWHHSAGVQGAPRRPTSPRPWPRRHAMPNTNSSLARST